MSQDREALSDQGEREVIEVPVWTVRPGTMARGWPARIQGQCSALDLEVVPAITLWEAYCATCDGIPLPFGAWITQDGPTQAVVDVRELREAYDTVGEQLTEAEADLEALKAHNPLTCELCHAEGFGAELASLRAENERLRKAVTVWVESPQSYMSRVNAIRRVLSDPEYAAQMAGASDEGGAQ